MKTTLTGYSFRPTQVQPEGLITLKWDKTNAYDDRAISAHYDGTHIGYLKRGSEEQSYCFNLLRNDKMPKATVVEYKFAYKEGEKLIFNDEHKGDLMHVELEIEGHVGYTRNGQDYISITNLLGYLNPTGGMGNIIRWAIEKFERYPDYEQFMCEAADKGTAMHTMIEEYLKKREIGNDGIKNFVKKFDPEVISLEQRLFSPTGVAGTYDALLRIGGKNIVVDWKSSKKPQLKHKIQGAFYANELGADEVWIVTFGGTTRQGYSVSKVSRDKIITYSAVIEKLAEIYSLLK